MKFKYFIVLIFFLFGCYEEPVEETLPVEEESSIEYVEESSNYNNGTYCAEVEYYNPRTGTNSTYTLVVEVEDGRLVKIEWPNGGWLDEDHYSGVEISESGEASFESDRGNQYTIQIISSSACSFNGYIESDGIDNSDEDLDEDANEEEEELDPYSYN